MYLYNLTLSPTTSINAAIVGNFSGGSAKQQEIVVAKNTILEVYKPDPNTGKISSVLSHNVFGIIRSIVPFRLIGSTKDYIIVGSDSGRIVILEYNPQKNILEKLHQETYGKTGCRRIIPGQYLAADPKGRAVMIGAVEKQKLVYVLNRDAANRLTISSPLEAHKSSTVCQELIGVDVGYENPIFASIEIDFSEIDEDSTGQAFQEREKMLVFYELDLGLNHVVRKWSHKIPLSSHHLIPVPGGVDGPSGVLVCSEGIITWVHPNFESVAIPVPKRPDPLRPAQDPNVPPTSNGIPPLGEMIISSVVHRLKKGFFILAQTEAGDVFKLTMEFGYAQDGNIGKVEALKIKYFDTLPPTISLCLLKTGFLFTANEFGNHGLYQIENLGDDDEEQIEYSSADFAQDSIDSMDFSGITFNPRLLSNLSLVDELESLCPLTDAKVLNLTEEDTPQIYALCGRGSRSTFRILRHGLEVSELAVSELPGNPSAVWTVRGAADEIYDSFIVVSFVNATLVLSIGENVEEVTDTGFLASTPTIDVCQLGEDTLVQVYPQGIRHIRSDRRVSEWRAPANRTIVKSATNKRQVVIALSGGELVYFELDGSGHLNEYHERKEMSTQITSLALSPLSEYRSRAGFIAIGCADNTVRILSLEPNTCLESLSMQALNAPAESLALIEMVDPTTTLSTLYLNIGLQNGVLLKTTIDGVTGVLSDTRVRFLGSRPVKLFPVQISGNPAVLALSSRPWLSFTHQSTSKLLPMSYETLEFGSSFCSEQCPEGIVAVAGNTLRILSVDKLGQVFNHASVPLKYTPRKFLFHEPSRHFIILESDTLTWSSNEKQKLLESSNDSMDEPQELPVEHFGLPMALPGKWASCIRTINPVDGETTSLVELQDNEAAFSLTLCAFGNSNTPYLIIGTAADLKFRPKSFSTGFLQVFKILPSGQLEFLHKTPIDGVPLALCAFQGRLLVGVGKLLRIYDIGKKKLLRKCECKNFSSNIISLHTQGDRIIVGDSQESVHFASYRHFDNRIVIFADDYQPRHTTCTAYLDYDTVAGGDKFGNVFINRIPEEISQDVDEDPTGNKSLYDRGYLNGAPHKLERKAQTFVGETISSIGKYSLVPGGREIIAYTTLLGAVGLLIPFVSKEDYDFFQTLEMALRNEIPPLCGRDHLAFRSFYAPAFQTIDGDLCERYNQLPNEKKRAIAEQLDRTTGEIAKKIEDVRNRVAF